MDEDYYDLLGLKKTASEEEIKKAYKDLARKHHPDKGGDPEMFKKISEAYGVLSDSELREKYNRFGKKGMEGVDMSQHFPDFFNMFGGMMRPGGGGGGARRTQDRVIPLEVTMEEAYKGVSVKYRYKRKVFEGNAEKCGMCGGQGKIAEQMSHAFTIIQNIRICPGCTGMGTTFQESQFQSKTEIVDVTVPPHCHVGYQVVIRGKADEMPNHTTGDVILRITIKKHDVFELLHDRDLLWKVSLHPLEALTSFSRRVTLPSGESISIGHREGEPFFSQLRTRNVVPHKGLYDAQRNRGNLLIEFHLQDFHFPAAKKNALFDLAGIPIPPIESNTDVSLLYTDKMDPSAASNTSRRQQQQPPQHGMPQHPFHGGIPHGADVQECRQS
jgi:DnaJ-class molecular chaperone